MKEIKVEITFTEMILGTSSGNPDIHKEFIARRRQQFKEGVKE